MNAEAAPERRRFDYVVAALMTAALPTALAGLVIWLAPQGCHLSRDPEAYRWACLLPALILTVAPVTAVVLGVATLLSRRLARWIGRSWIATAVLWGILVHLFLIGSLLVRDPGYVSIFLWDIVLIPQPIVSGALAAGVFVGAMRWRARRAAE